MKRPNILLIYTDQQRWDAVGANGNPEIRTPHLDRLAAEGVNFDHCFVQNPVCMPSRISMLSGQYPSSTGITHMGVPVPQDLMTLPKYLSPYGYHTANIGKLHFLPHANRDHREPHPTYGFDHLEISDEPGPYEDAYRAWVRSKAPEELDQVSLGLPPATAVWNKTMGWRDTVKHPQEGGVGRFDNKGATPFASRDDLSHSAFVAEQTIEFLRHQPAGRPFCCIAGFYSPHSPWVAPQRFLDLYDPDQLTLPDYPPELERPAARFTDPELRSARQGYYGMVSEVDHHVGRILDVVESHGLTNNTVVIFTSDHGEWLGEHLKYGKGYPAHDMVSRVPLIVRGPSELVNGGRRHEGLCEAVDILPTILACAGVQLAPVLQGCSLGGVLAGGDDAVKDCVLMEHAGWKMLRSATHRYIMRQDGEEHLYELAAEYGEYRDVVAEPGQAAELAAHRAMMLQRVLEMERPLARTWCY